MPRKNRFDIKDCALVAIATGVRAQNLKELQMAVTTVHPGSIHYHFWGSKLRPIIDVPVQTNDFAVWARHGLHDHVLSERLSMIDPTEFADTEHLRQELLEVVEERLDESAHIPWSAADQQFHFIRSQLVVFDTHHAIADPRALCDAIDQMSLGSVYYHVISARQRDPIGVDDFQAWLHGFEPSTEAARNAIASIDPFFLPLSELRTALVTALRPHCQAETVSSRSGRAAPAGTWRQP